MGLGALDELAPAPARAIVINVHTDLWAARPPCRPSIGRRCRCCSSTAIRRGEPSASSSRSRPSIRSTSSRLRCAQADALDWLFERQPTSSCSCSTPTPSCSTPTSSRGCARRCATRRVRRRLRGGPVLDGRGLARARTAPSCTWSGPGCPCLLLRVEHVRRAQAAGFHFREQLIPNEFRFSRRVSNVLAARYDEPWGTRDPLYERLPERVRRRDLHVVVRLVALGARGAPGLEPQDGLLRHRGPHPRAPQVGRPPLRRAARSRRPRAGCTTTAGSPGARCTA